MFQQVSLSVFTYKLMCREKLMCIENLLCFMKAKQGSITDAW